MFRAAALVPSPPLLVPELMGRDSGEAAELRIAAVAAAGELASVAERWIAIGVDTDSSVFGPDTVGTFRAFGVDAVVSLSAGVGESEPDPNLPLAVLIAGWLRGEAGDDRTAVEVRTVASTTNAGRCAEIGVDLREELEKSALNWGVLVLGDGANTLTPKAPGAFDERSGAVQTRVNDALAMADVATLAGLDEQLCASIGVGGRAPWQVLAGLVGSNEIRATELYRDAPFGVGYFVGTWIL